MTTRLYVIPASHPATAAALMLDYKGIAFKRTDLMPVVSKGRCAPSASPASRSRR